MDVLGKQLSFYSLCIIGEWINVTTSQREIVSSLISFMEYCVVAVAVHASLKSCLYTFFLLSSPPAGCIMLLGWLVQGRKLLNMFTIGVR